MFLLRRGPVTQDAVDDNVPCFVTEGSTGGDAAQPQHREGVKVFWGSNKVEIRTRHATLNTVLSREENPVIMDLFTLEIVWQARKEERYCQERTKSVSSLQSCFGYDLYGKVLQKSKVNVAF